MFVLDTDPGIDDALALLLMNGLVDDRCVLVSTYGNAPRQQTQANLLGLRAAYDCKAQVYEGARGPLGGGRMHFDGYYGPDALGGVSALLPPVRGSLPPIDLIGEALAHGEEVTYCAIGPLTNLAGLIAGQPRFAEAISRVIVMGGAIERFNAPGDSEFNFHADPAAVRTVFGSGLPICLAPFDLAASHPMTADEVEAVCGTCDNDVVRELVVQGLAAARRQGRNAADIHDVATVLYYADEQAYVTEQMRLAVTDSGGVRVDDEGIEVTVLVRPTDEGLLARAIVDCARALPRLPR